MNSSILSTITAKIDSLPTLSTIVNRVMEVTADPESSVNDLMEVITPDASLTTTILKMANSAFFGVSRTVSSLQQAVSILGFNEIQNLILAKSVFNSFKDTNAGGQFDIRRFWEHSFLCGLASKIIAIDARVAGDDFFVAGLIHDIGKLVIYMALPVEFMKIMEIAGAHNPGMFQIEKSNLELTHDELGMRLLKRWMFPENLVIAVGFHHRLEEAKEQHLYPIVVHMADILAHLESFANDAEIFPEELLGTEIRNLWQAHGQNWDESDIKEFQHELAKRKEEEAVILNMLLS